MDIFSILAIAVSLYIAYYVIGAVGFIFCFYFAVKRLYKIIKKQEEEDW